MRPVKIGIATDVHFGEFESMVHMKNFVDDMNTRFRPDLVVELGDLVGYPASARELQEINDAYMECRAPRYHVVGNHDLARLSRCAFKRTVGVDYDWTTANVGFLQCIFLDTAWGQWNDRSSGPLGHISREQLEWLKRHLATVPRCQPVVVFSHVPIRVFSDRKWAQCVMDNEDELMEILSGHNLLATFGGHISPGGYREVDGVHHFCLRKMWEAGAYTKVTITRRGLRVDGENGQMDFQLSWARGSIVQQP